MSTITEITSLAAWSSHLSSLPEGTLLIVSFHAPWAAPCAQMATVLVTLAGQYSPASSRTSWVSVNAEELSDLSEQYDVTAVPFLVLIRDGRVLESVSGSAAPKVRAAIERHAPALPQETAAISSSISSAAQPSLKTAPEPEPEPTASAATETTMLAKATKETLFKRLAELVGAAPVMLFMKGTPSEPQCGFSRQMVSILREKSVKFGFFNILADDEVRQGLKEFAEWPTYPQLWVDGELVGGLDIVKEELANDPDFLEAHRFSANGKTAA